MDYNKCLIDIELSDKEIVENFKKLHPYLAEWVNKREDNLMLPTAKLIKYIVACYDPESPIVKENQKRWTVKKREAAILSGLTSESTKASLPDIDKVLYCKNETINRVTVRYISMLSDRDFMMYAIYNEMLINQSAELLAFNFDKPADLLRAKQNIEQVQDDIIRLEQKLFSGDDVRSLKNILQDEGRKFVVSELRPENLVAKHEKGEMVVDSPYGEGYKPKKMKFVDDR